MVRVHVTDLEGEERAIDAEIGLSLMENIRDNDFEDLLALCGGCCSCATCHVYVDEDWLDKLDGMEDDEDELLSTSDACKENSRLSCQIEVSKDLEGLKVTIAPSE